MTKAKIIIREAPGSQDNLETIKSLAGITIKEEEITKRSTEADYLKLSYLRRIESASKAFKLVSEACVTDDKRLDTLKKRIDELMQFYSSQLKNPKFKTENYQGLLVFYLRQVESILSTIPEIKNSGIAPSKWLSKADEYIALGDKPILATVIEKTYDGKTFQIIQMEIPQQPISNDTLKEFLNAHPQSNDKPLWYQVMPDYEKKLFDQSMKAIHEMEEGDQKKEAMKGKIQAISSRHRTLPGVANFSKHVFCILDEKGNVVVKHERLRSSMVSSRDIQKYDIDSKTKAKLRNEFTVNNITQLIQVFFDNKIKDNPDFLLNNPDWLKLPILLQTLISPVSGSGIAIPDLDLYEDKKKAVETILSKGILLKFTSADGQTQEHRFTPNLISTNHPLNAARHLKRTGSMIHGSDTTGKGIKELCRLVDAKKDASDELKNLKGKLLAIFQDIPNVVSDLLSDNQRELHIAALEEMMVARLGGLSYGSCVSGKDRKALELMYVDAMEMYKAVYGDFPEFNEKDPVKRKNFTEIYADIYLSRHHHENAGQNSPGADGIKTPSKYLPEDIQKAIIEKSGNQTILKESDRLASNNEFDHLLNKVPNTPRNEALKAAGAVIGGVIVLAGVMTILAVASVFSFGLLPLILFPVVVGGLALAAGAASGVYENEKEKQRAGYRVIEGKAHGFARREEAKTQGVVLCAAMPVVEKPEQEVKPELTTNKEAEATPVLEQPEPAAGDESVKTFSITK